MSDTRRHATYIDDFLERVARTWRRSPDSRFGQLVSNIAGSSGDLSRVTDEEFQRALDEWDARREASRRELERAPRKALDPRLEAEVARTNEEYRTWALTTFGRVGRDPARIGPFLARLGEAWAERPDVAFCELIASSAGPNLRLLEEDAFRQLLDRPGSMTAEEIEAAYIYRGPLGDLLDRLEPPNPESFS